MAQAESSIVEAPVRWDAASGYQYDTEVLEPFEGYWVKNVTDSIVVLRIPPGEAISDTGEVNLAAGSARNRADWLMRIEAASCGVTDNASHAGVAYGACSGWDVSDRSKAPMEPGRALALYFPHDDWGPRSGTYAVDMRDVQSASKPVRTLEPLPLRDAGDTGSRGHIWDFDIAKTFCEGDAGDEVLLTFEGIEAIPEASEVWLLDRRLDRMHNLREGPAYRCFVGQEPISAKPTTRFALLVGSDEFVNRRGQGSLDLPGHTALGSNRPNPFKTTTIIRYDVSRPSRIDIKIYDVTGSLVRTLYSGRCEPGRYEIAWDGRNETHRRVSQGIYFCCMQWDAGASDTRKILLVR